MTRACQTCEYWDARTHYQDARNIGWCRFEPPQKNGSDDGEYNWPTTTDEDWCSRWTRREELPPRGQLLTCTFCGKGVQHLTCYGADCACSDCLGVPDDASQTLRFSRLRDLVAAKEK